MKLISHSDYEELIDLPTVSDAEFRIKSRNYRNFLKQPLKLEMFVSCDEDENVLEEPKSEYQPVAFWNAGEVDEKYSKLFSKYEEAREKVFFEGFEVCKRNSKFDCIVNENLDFHISYPFNSKTIEDLVKFNLTLKPNAIKS